VAVAEDEDGVGVVDAAGAVDEAGGEDALVGAAAVLGVGAADIVAGVAADLGASVFGNASEIRHSKPLVHGTTCGALQPRI
jgi:hypothetical protein